MLLRVRSSQDLLAGALFVAFGAAAFLFSLDFDMGAARRMGPAYFPRVLGGLLMVLGTIVALRGLVLEGPPLQGIAARPFLVLAGVLFFGLTVDRFGLAVATAGLVLVSALGGHEFRLREGIVLAAVLTVMAVLIFVEGLGMPMPVLP